MDYRAQQELEEERLYRTLYALDKVARAGLIEEADFLARELSVNHLRGEKIWDDSQETVGEALKIRRWGTI